VDTPQAAQALLAQTGDEFEMLSGRPLLDPSMPRVSKQWHVDTNGTFMLKRCQTQAVLERIVGV
jgi:hypothetical protein